MHEILEQPAIVGRSEAVEDAGTAQARKPTHKPTHRGTQLSMLTLLALMAPCGKLRAVAAPPAEASTPLAASERKDSRTRARRLVHTPGLLNVVFSQGVLVLQFASGEDEAHF